MTLSKDSKRYKERKKARRKRERAKKKRRRQGKICKVCGSVAHSGTSFCLTHLPHEMRCEAFTENGTQCKLPRRGAGFLYCKVHDVETRSGSGGSKGSCVYVFDTGCRNEYGVRLYKIGSAKDYKCREFELQAGNPHGHVVMTVPGGGKKEKALHRQLRDVWEGREIFALTKHHLDMIESGEKFKIHTSSLG